METTGTLKRTPAARNIRTAVAPAAGSEPAGRANRYCDGSTALAEKPSGTVETRAGEIPARRSRVIPVRAKFPLAVTTTGRGLAEVLSRLTVVDELAPERLRERFPLTLTSSGPWNSDPSPHQIQ